MSSRLTKPHLTKPHLTKHDHSESSSELRPDLKRPIYLRGVVKHYAWGKQSSSFVSDISKLNQSLATSNEGPFAELWFGAHQAGNCETALPQAFDEPNLTTDALPIKTEPLNCNLATLIKNAPITTLGKTPNETLEDQLETLPFMVKIISINEPLSIQVHPDLETAASLHCAKPELYPDSNHKPEVAVALTEVELLCGLRNTPDILSTLIKHLSLRSFLNFDLQERIMSTTGTATHTAFGKPTSSGEEIVKHYLNSLLELAPLDARRVSLSLVDEVREIAASHEPLTDTDRWLLRLAQSFPDGDLGLIFLYLLNLVKLAPNEAIGIAPNTIHSYLSGELLECLASSDNVIRVGLTKKKCDQPVFRKIVANHRADSHSLVRTSLDTISTTPHKTPSYYYSWDFSEFAIYLLQPEIDSPTEFSCATSIDTSINTSINKDSPTKLSNSPLGKCRNKARIMLSLDASGTVLHDGKYYKITPGTCYFLPAIVNDFVIHLISGKLFLVSAG